MKTAEQIRIAILVAIFASINCVGCTESFAQDVSKQALAVDVVGLFKGKKIHGIVTDETESQVKILVERTWLETNHPEIYKNGVKEEKKAQAESRKILLTRLEKWLKERSTGDDMLSDFLNNEIDRISDEPVDRQHQRLFMRLVFDKKKVRQVYRQPKEHRQVAGLSWQHQLPGVSTTSAKKLRKQLSKKKVDIETATFDLSDDIPRENDSPRTWAARQALVEFRLMESVEYQGTTSNMVRLTDNPDIGKLVSGMMQSQGADQLSQLGEELGLPEFKKSDAQKQKEANWWKEGTEYAASKNINGVLFSRIAASLLETKTVVDVSFFARMPTGEWEEVVRFTGTCEPNEVAAEDLAVIKEDPRIKQVLQMMSGIGGDDRLDAALRRGATTSIALKKAQSKFSDFSLNSSHRVDSPIEFK